MSTVITYALVMFNVFFTDVAFIDGEFQNEGDCLVAMAVFVNESNLHSHIKQLACVEIERQVREV